jgi:hypothetical protein
MKYAFIHIPKCAGMSFQKAIRNDEMASSKIKFFGHSVLANELLGHKQIIVLRNPLDRFASAFFYLRQYIRNKNRNINNPCELIDGLMQFDLNCFEFLKVQNHTHTVNGKKINTDWVFHPQSSWVHNPEIVMLYDNLQDDVIKLNNLLNTNITLEVINQSKKVNFEYKQHHIEFLKLYYKQDFEYYNQYSQKITEK